MKLREEQVDFISGRIVRKLTADDFIRTPDRMRLTGRVRQAFLADLQVEDRLNEEVRAILRQYQDQMQRGNVDYGEMFKITKNRLIRERKLVL